MSLSPPRPWIRKKAEIALRSSGPFAAAFSKNPRASASSFFTPRPTGQCPEHGERFRVLLRGGFFHPLQRTLMVRLYPVRRPEVLSRNGIGRPPPPRSAASTRSYMFFVSSADGAGGTNAHNTRTVVMMTLRVAFIASWLQPKNVSSFPAAVADHFDCND